MTGKYGKADRISTGNPEVDGILAGGFPRNSINVIMGQPGSGKTVFIEQLVFHNAGDDRPILYLTTLSEPVAKVIKYLERFKFFDEAKLGTAVMYEDIGPHLVKDGIGALLPVLHDAIASSSPKIIVIDSFKALHDLATSVPEMRQMMYEMTGMLTAYDTTVFLLGEYTDDQARQLPELAVADSILQLLRQPQSTRDERFLRVLKLRGSGYLEGLHSFKITNAGLEVYPRLVSPEYPDSYHTSEERMSWGVPGMDALLGGGLWQGSTTLLAGSAGAGKTTMALQFVLEGVRLGERSLYINFQENPTQLARTLRNLGVDLTAAKAGGLSLMYASPVELQVDSLIVTLFRRIREEGIRRVVVDALGDLTTATSDPQRLHDYLYALIQHFTVQGVTTILNVEASGSDASSSADIGGRFCFLADNLVLLTAQREGEIKRKVAVLKARGTAHDLGVHAFAIVDGGARVL